MSYRLPAPPVNSSRAFRSFPATTSSGAPLPLRSTSPRWVSSFTSASLTLGRVGSRPVDELLPHRVLGQRSLPRRGQLGNVVHAGHLPLRQQCAVRAEPAILLHGLRMDRRPSSDVTVMGLTAAGAVRRRT